VVVSGVQIGGTLLHGLGQEATTKIIKDFVSIACIEFLLIDAGIQLVNLQRNYAGMIYIATWQRSCFVDGRFS